jgi:hypothetical protein
VKESFQYCRIHKAYDLADNRDMFEKPRVYSFSLHSDLQSLAGLLLCTFTAWVNLCTFSSTIWVRGSLDISHFLLLQRQSAWFLFIQLIVWSFYPARPRFMLILPQFSCRILIEICHPVIEAWIRLAHIGEVVASVSPYESLTFRVEALWPTAALSWPVGDLTNSMTCLKPKGYRNIIDLIPQWEFQLYELDSFSTRGSFSIDEHLSAWQERIYKILSKTAVAVLSHAERHEEEAWALKHQFGVKTTSAFGATGLQIARWAALDSNTRPFPGSVHLRMGLVRIARFLDVEDTYEITFSCGPYGSQRRTADKVFQRRA